MSEAFTLDLPAAESRAPAAPTLVAVAQYEAGQYISADPVAGFVFITDGEDGHWQPGWAHRDQIGISDAQYWLAERRYKPTHFAMPPAAPVDGVTI